jgi:uncharacterized phage protein (TIGR01671 family)|tara:strand:+ start:453 stop:863 length:411 start_codon:yes stop_codon:yes gene_type:complete
MRDIKFRAWDSKSKCMFTPPIVDCDGKAGHFLDNGVPMYSLYEMPVMQYTGLKDMNGVEIYEGDIVCHFNDVVFRDKKFHIERSYEINVVQFHYGMFCLSVDDELPMGLWINAKECEFEVIGNKYANPELVPELVK